MAKFTPDLEEEGYYDRRLAENITLEREQAEIARKAEQDLLDGELQYAEFRERRHAQQFLVVEPELDLDEMTFQDYKKARAHNQKVITQPHLEMGEMSYADFKKAREQDLEELRKRGIR